jgi:hypothetical protein
MRFLPKRVSDRPCLICGRQPSDREESASLLEQLLRAVQALESPEAALAWACQAIGAPPPSMRGR